MIILVKESDEVISDANAEALEGPQSSSIDVYACMHATLKLPVVHYNFLHFADVKRQVGVMVAF